ncbi:hypothetical protein ACF05L_37435 [Streptomyces bobili]|uniref:hypothetical protein n=1 Tax=Streptomyces bobili TaxID=67280 RepID=UPI0036F78457
MGLQTVVGGHPGTDGRFHQKRVHGCALLSRILWVENPRQPFPPAPKAFCFGIPDLWATDLVCLEQGLNGRRSQLGEIEQIGGQYRPEAAVVILLHMTFSGVMRPHIPRTGFPGSVH